jgi:hypothetical protein
MRQIKDLWVLSVLSGQMLIALCDDGSLWGLLVGVDKWVRLSDIPQDVV